MYNIELIKIFFYFILLCEINLCAIRAERQKNATRAKEYRISLRSFGISHILVAFNYKMGKSWVFIVAIFTVGLAKLLLYLENITLQ